ncbi:ChaN family lipoprotein [Sulfurimonas sp.]|uniref:ChaN family lipoprotein n=1 Tax=Sulfurimonas sp. TaxID=2022749 RepID=UPI002620B906|nr:ChaN family lipoprotein [Sulfurimonas sp.]MCW8894386.1 ChaN family lipoprotein [Sulfurimonas sp.]MCW9068304.1 ChaN family lipoprotein [Sulfurimonas sp.]
MKKLFLLSTLLLSAMYAHECRYTLEIDMDIDKGLLQGHAVIESDHPMIKLLDTKAKILEIKNATLSVENNMPNLVKQNDDKAVEISFTHNFKSIKGDAILLDEWYPKVDIMCKYETIISNPQIITIVEATEVKEQKNSKHFIFDNPLDTLHLIASKNYIVNSKKTKNGMDLSTYFYKEDSYLSKDYFDKSEKYFNLYKDMFGFIPFDRFSVLETPFPAGYSMSTFTLIGKQIISKDFVLDNSLGHEIAHQWFGNYVYSPSVGNWAEGITTFYSDYLFAKKENRAAEYRKDMLVKYNSYVNANNETSLIEFKNKTKESKNAIGYGKAAFFFYMLEEKIGKKAFEKGTRELLKKYPFKVATYKNLREVYEEASGKELLDFFTKWVYKKGALDFDIKNIKLSYLKNRYILEFNVVSNNMVDFLPISICSDEECLSTKIDLNKQNPRVELDIEPSKIIVDENYEVFRKLHVKEIPPVISKILEGNVLVVIDRADEKKFKKMAHTFKGFKYSDDVTYEELKNNNIFILGANNSLIKRVAIDFKMQGDTKIEIYKNPLNDKNVVAVFEMKELSSSIFYKLKHLGKYSKVVFKASEIVEKTIKPSINGVEYKVNSGSYAIATQVQNFNDTLKDIAKNKIVFVGENHTSFSSHLNQLKVIKAMYKNNPKLSIGMEMFQKPFQKYLDAFVAGKISEKDMLTKTEYFKRWKYDYELYRPIMLFAKEKGIPIIALNIDRDITKMVVSKGLDALSDKQRAQVPPSIDFSNTEYKKYLEMVYAMHKSKSFKNFDEFYHAQLLWDESMAQNIVDYIQKNPNTNMTVLAGNGHVMHGYGIPSRIKRRGLQDYAIAVNMKSAEPGIADYILYPSSVGTKKAKKLGVYLESDEELIIKKLAEKSVAAEAGVKAGDMITAFNGTKVKNLFELKRELAFANKSVKLTLLRDSKKIDATVEFSD